MEVEHFFASQNELGEGPLWNREENRLYWVDIQRGEMHRIDPETMAHEVEAFGGRLGSIALHPAGAILSLEKSLLLWDRATKEVRPIATIDDPGSERFNEGVVDPAGRFWVGTSSPTKQGKLFRLDADGTFQVFKTGICTSNGTGWSPDRKTMYYTDSPRGIIYAYDYDLETGAIENERTFVSVDADTFGHLDGLTVDVDGFVWSAIWDGWKIMRYDPDGKVEREIPMPVQRPTSCTFGGSDLSTLYITTAKPGADQRADQPTAGDLYRIHTDFKGQPASIAAFQFSA